MANLFGSKYRSGWTTKDLLNYNIRVSSQSPNQFYGQSLPKVQSLSSIDPNLLSGTLNTQGLSDETYRLLQYLDLASRANSSKDSAREILRVLGYEKRGLLLRSCYAIPLVINSSSNQSVQADVCLVQGSSTILLVVHEDMTTASVHDPEPQVIAEAIAAFRCNNLIRARLAESELDSMTIPCITMIGTRPTFYLVPVTRALSEAVATYRLFQCHPTVVKKCVVANSHRLSEGMETPSFRKIALRHFSAFRTLAEAHWSAFMMPVEMRAYKKEEFSDIEEL